MVVHARPRIRVRGVAIRMNQRLKDGSRLDLPCPWSLTLWLSVSQLSGRSSDWISRME